MFLPLKPFSERRGNPQLSADAALKRLGGQYFAIQDAMILTLPAPPVDGVGNAGGFKMQIEDQQGLGYTALQNAVDNLANKARTIPGLNPYSLFTTFRANEPQLFLDIDRTKVRHARASR
ncbi:MAG: efflux RND transporter permease subunit [Pirellulales bacterium]